MCTTRNGVELLLLLPAFSAVPYLLAPSPCLPLPGQVSWHEADQHETRPGAEIKTRPFPQDRAPTEREDREQRNSA